MWWYILFFPKNTFWSDILHRFMYSCSCVLAINSLRHYYGIHTLRVPQICLADTRTNCSQLVELRLIFMINYVYLMAVDCTAAFMSLTLHTHATTSLLAPIDALLPGWPAHRLHYPQHEVSSCYLLHFLFLNSLFAELFELLPHAQAWISQCRMWCYVTLLSVKNVGCMSYNSFCWSRQWGLTDQSVVGGWDLLMKSTNFLTFTHCFSFVLSSQSLHCFPYCW